MIDDILIVLKSDAQCARLLEKAQEYAQVYILAKQRQKGCNGMGEMTTLREEFKEVIDEIIEYCKKENYIPDNILYDIDLIADRLVELGNR